MSIFACLSIYLHLYLSIDLSIQLSIYVSIYEGYCIIPNSSLIPNTFTTHICGDLYQRFVLQYRLKRKSVL